MRYFSAVANTFRVYCSLRAVYTVGGMTACWSHYQCADDVRPRGVELFATRESGVGGTLSRNSVSSAMLRCICDKERKGSEKGHPESGSTRAQQQQRHPHLVHLLQDGFESLGREVKMSLFFRCFLDVNLTV